MSVCQVRQKSRPPVKDDRLDRGHRGSHAAGARLLPVLALARGSPVFSFHDGPPYAKWRHPQQAPVNKILNDIVLKCSILARFDAGFVRGWDYHEMPRVKYREVAGTSK
jgi:hypothetical protein